MIWSLRGVVKRFRSGGLLSSSVHTAVDGANLEVRAGQRLGLIGSSGSGKSTLVRCGLGLMPLDGGTVHLFGQDTHDWSAANWRGVRRRAQLLFQDPWAMLHPSIPVGALVEESAAVHGAANPRRAASEALGAVGLGARQKALPGELSGGERRRAGLARLLVAKPDLVVADEPTAGLDAPRKAATLELLLEHVGEQCAVVIITHDVGTVSWCCDTVAVMHAGQVVDTFPTPSLTEAGWAPSHPHTAALLGAAGWRAPC